MKKSLYVISFLVLLAVVFLAGARFNQRESSQGSAATIGRQILHYVDPMNPGHTSKEPGIAPCGMPMEPVYADKDAIGNSGTVGLALSTTPGTVQVNLQKQQIIGVQVGEVMRTSETSKIRAFGRIIPDENRVFLLIAPTDGWMEEINESTTGSLVNANQLLAQIKVYNEDFFTWQKKYHTELLGIQYRLTNITVDTERRKASTTNISGSENIRKRRLSGRQAKLPDSVSEIQATEPPVETPQETAISATPQMAESPSPHMPAFPEETKTSTLEPPPASTQTTEIELSTTPNSARQTENAQNATPHHTETTSIISNNNPAQPGAEPLEQRESNTLENDKQLGFTQYKHTPYTSAARQALLGFGVTDSQLTKITNSYKFSYLTHVDIRSPVDGFVLSRKISSLQKIDRGAECFKIADLARVWVETDIYDTEAKYFLPGMQARISLPKQNKHFAAVVSSIPPRFDAVTRTLKVRLEMDNPGNLFRPDMFVDVEFLVPLPESVTVPSGAVIDSGNRKTVYVVKGEGIFEPRTVMTGWRSSDRIEIVEGVQPGEKIVISGNFLIDSESRMKLAAARLMEEKAEQPLQQQMPAAAQTSAPQAVPPAIKKEARAQKTKDPVCGMSVNPDQATAAGFTAEVDGKRYFFCSADCKEQFTQEPQRYLGEQAEKPKQTDASAHKGHQHD